MLLYWVPYCLCIGLIDAVCVHEFLIVLVWCIGLVQKCMETGEKMYAHAGIVGAASAVLQDLKEHGILHALLDNDYSCQEDPSRWDSILAPEFKQA